MVQSVMLTVLTHIFLVSQGVLCFEGDEGASPRSGAVDLPWQDELCCYSSSEHLDNTSGPQTNRSGSNLPHRHCIFKSSTNDSHLHQGPDGPCLDVLCRLDENWENVTCDLRSQNPISTRMDSGLMAVSLQRLWSQKDDPEPKDGTPAPENPVVCEATHSFTCSVAADLTTSSITVVTISISDATAPPVLLKLQARPVKPSPPVNLSHIQTIEAELILHWDPPSNVDSGLLRYEVQYSSNTTHPAWQLPSLPTEPRLSLDLKPSLNYTIRVRCSGLGNPPLWSDWSEPHHICLDTVSYIPQKVVVRPGENVTVYCVFNDHNINASTAMWILNFEQRLQPNQYHPVNQWVSQITVRPSEARMYDLLQCTQTWNRPYSQIFVQGASIDINCETNGDIDSMDCSWKNTQWTEPEFRYRWADLPCHLMEESERAGETVGEVGPACLQGLSRQNSCRIKPLRMNCYKLWLEVSSRLGPIRSKPVYLSPIDHVKPHTPTDVKAASQSSGVLKVTWEPPSLPVEGLQCQSRYHSPSALRAQPEWKVQSPVLVPKSEVAVSDMCRVYVVQVRCMPTNGVGFWSDWSDSIYSTPQNSRAPERGPDFWRGLQDDPYRNQTNVTLLFENLQISGSSYCVDGFIVQHQAADGSVTREEMELMSSYSFEWNQMPQTVTVEAYNSQGSSSNNINMTLKRQPKRSCVRSFSVLVINSSCVSLSWTLLDNSSVPLSMVVQWSQQRQQDSHHYKGRSGNRWARLPHTDRSTYLRGDFFSSEEFGFLLYPVFADGEGEPVYSTATRSDPVAYMMLMIISFLSIVLFVTLVLSQNQMKKFMWRDVPNPNKCSWAKGLDLQKADTFDHLFRSSEGTTAWPLLLPTENISRVVIAEQVDLSVLSAALFQPSDVDRVKPTEDEVVRGGVPSFALDLDALTGSNPDMDGFPLDNPTADQRPGSSAQSSITYATVLLSDPKQEQQHLHYKDGSGSSSIDEGNFSANNSDISGSFPCGLWELDDPRRSCSYNSVEELSETSEHRDEEEVRVEKGLYYLGMDYPAEDEESEEEEQRGMEAEPVLLKKKVLNREDCPVESHPLLRPDGDGELLSASAHGVSLYLPQFRTAPRTRHLTAQPSDVKPQP